MNKNRKKEVFSEAFGPIISAIVELIRELGDTGAQVDAKRDTVRIKIATFSTVPIDQSQILSPSASISPVIYSCLCQLIIEISINLMTGLTNKTRMKGECKESKTESYEEPYETDADRYRKRQNHPTKKSHQKRGRERDRWL